MKLPNSGGMPPLKLLPVIERVVRADKLAKLEGRASVRLKEGSSKTVTRFSPWNIPQLTPGHLQGPVKLFSTHVAGRFNDLVFHVSNTAWSWLNPGEIQSSEGIACNSECQAISQPMQHQ